MNQKALVAFREALSKGIRIYEDKELSYALNAAFQFMYTNTKVVGITHDPDTGELFVAMNYGQIWKRVRDTTDEKWVWEQMEPIPGSVASGGGREPGYPIVVNQSTQPAPAP